MEGQNGPRNAQHEAPHAWTNDFKEVGVDWELIRGLSLPLLSHAFHLSLPVFHSAFMEGQFNDVHDAPHNRIAKFWSQALSDNEKRPLENENRLRRCQT